MKRRLLIIAVFLLDGAVVNVAVAWASASWPRWAQFFEGPVEQDLGASDIVWWNKHVFPLFDGEVEYVFETRDLGVEWRVFFGPYSNQRMGGAIHVSSGWPARAMSGETWEAWVPGQRPQWSNRQAMFVGEGLLPLRPIWPGFAVNTLFYAAILWLLIPGPFALRRLVRQRRGLCLACGYDLCHGEHEACPECGVNPAVDQNVHQSGSTRVQLKGNCRTNVRVAISPKCL